MGKHTHKIGRGLAAAKACRSRGKDPHCSECGERLADVSFCTCHRKPLHQAKLLRPKVKLIRRAGQ